MYAEHFKLYKYIKFNTSVLNISILPDKKWKIKYITKSEGIEKEETFDYVMVCTGHHHKPQLPKYKGMDVFAGQQLHSHFYRRYFLATFTGYCLTIKFLFFFTY